MANEFDNLLELKYTIYDGIRMIKDPEKDFTLEELNVIDEDKVKVEKFDDKIYHITIEFCPTVPHCSLTSLIGLCLRVKLQQLITIPYKLNIIVTPGSHNSEQEINKQVNDKERVAAALENPDLVKLVDNCIIDS